MKKTLKIPTRYERFRGHIYRVVHRPYFAVALLGYAFVTAFIALYLSKAPTYKSQMSLVLPGTGASNKIQLDEVGQVTSQTDNPFGAGAFNPRVNYKEILSSKSIVDYAATRLNISSQAFGSPKVKLTEQTSIIEITVSGSSGDYAQTKAWALYEALQNELDRLRADEALRRDESVKNVLDQYRAKLERARKNILLFQERSLLVSTDQMNQLTSSLATLREKKMYTQSEARHLQDYVDQLGQDLGVSPNLAGQAFALQSDTEFRGYLKELDASAGRLTEYTSRWGDMHPKVKAERKRFENSRFALLDRSRSLLGMQSGDLLYTMDLQGSPRRADLFSTLVESFSRHQGLSAELKELENSELLLQERIKIYAREASELEKLEREFELAEAIFTSAAARLDAGKADIFASYPLVQLLAPPSIPSIPSSPKNIIAIVAALFGYFFITAFVLLIWQRSKFIELLLKREKRTQTLKH